MSARCTGYVFSETYLWHDTLNAVGNRKPGGLLQPCQHWEHPDTKRRLHSLLLVSGLYDHLKQIKPSAATRAQLLRFHTGEYVDRIAALSADMGGDAGEHTFMGPGSYEIALLSAGGVLRAIDAVMQGVVRNCYALVRPPGHHAMPHTARGFCIFGNVAIATKYALEELKLERVAVVDWDVHHGNGTEHALYADKRALFISVHQDDRYPPNSGDVASRGTGDAVGFNVNVPLPPGCGGAAYRAVFDEIVEPAMRAFAPQLIVVSCGFDAGAYDPLAQMMLQGGDFRAMTQCMVRVADACCDGRLVVCHEGGYSPQHVPFLGHAVIEELVTAATGAPAPVAVADPFEDAVSGFGGNKGHSLLPHQREAIDRARDALDLDVLNPH